MRNFLLVTTLSTSHNSIMKAHEDFINWEELDDKLKQLEDALNKNDINVVQDLVRRMVPEYAPTNKIVDWVHVQQKNS